MKGLVLIVQATLYLAVCGCPFLCAQQSGQQVQTNKRIAKQQSTFQKAPATKTSQPKQPAQPIPVFISTQPSTPTEESEERRHKENIEVQGKLVALANRQVKVGIAQAIAYFLTLLVIYWQGSHIVKSERAWVVIDADQNTTSLQNANWFQFYVWNSGKTPARVTYRISDVQLCDSIAQLPDAPQYRSNNLGTERDILLAPTGPGKMGTFNILAPSPWLDPATLSELANGKKVLCAFGSIRYKDAFRRKRYSNFGFYWVAVQLSPNRLQGHWQRIEEKPAYNKFT